MQLARFRLAGFARCATRSNVCFKKPAADTALNGDCCKDDAVPLWAQPQCAGALVCTGENADAKCSNVSVA